MQPPHPKSRTSHTKTNTLNNAPKKSTTPTETNTPTTPQHSTYSNSPTTSAEKSG